MTFDNYRQGLVGLVQRDEPMRLPPKLPRNDAGNVLGSYLFSGVRGVMTVHVMPHFPRRK